MKVSGIPFVVPAKFRAAIEAGKVIRRGALLLDASSGRILGHMQEAGLLNKVVGGVTAFSPFNPLDIAFQIFGAVQNEQIKRRLDVMQGMIGTLQAFQLANLVCAFVGIGVNIAAAVILLQRLKEVDQKLGEIREMIYDQRRRQDIDRQRGILQCLEVQLERLDQVPVRRDARPVVLRIDEELHGVFNKIIDELKSLSKSKSIDVNAIYALLVGLALCGSAQFKALLWLNEKEALRNQAFIQNRKLQELACQMPRDILQRKLPKAHDARRLSRDAFEIRMRFVSNLALCEQLIRMNIDGRAYLETVEQEDDSPLLILPFN